MPNTETIQTITRTIRDIPDFPKPGILFKDITPVLSDPAVFKLAVDALLEPCLSERPDVIMGIDARGFIFGAAAAYHLGIGFVPVRKKGKLPYKTIEQSYALEYGENTVAIHEDAVKKGDKVFIIDDLLATGGTAQAAALLADRLGARITGISFLVELGFLDGRQKLSGFPVHSVVKF
ncbi:adenine phosphoribosyltransferase [Oscillatoria amoena NRMC-F 0135]|nr:adenine phosphoribosyltransferase [Oscillatoria laete-virens]MDL5046526.1 adenine phosphoribosyltransferase [Oscillatoria amoena NRMC-F 0135]MDL5054858.1 adenine phosphoribosyltransferase [Oscillatoria laete-virens NRMC-F 0139]